MSHNIAGLVAKPEQLDQLGGALAALRRAPLGQGFAFAPVDRSLGGMPGTGGARTERFAHLSEGLIELLRASGAETAYVETNYFGGAGWQGAMVCAGSEVVYGPETGDFGPINEALGLLGVRRVPGRSADEFDCVGLGGFRDNFEALGVEEED